MTDTQIEKRNEFSGQVQTRKQTVEMVLAAQAKAEIEARYIVAMERPRNMLSVRDNLLKACARPGFAGDANQATWGAAWWKKKQGKGSIEGFSVRFAEESLRCMGNMDARSTVIFEDDMSRIVKVEVIDLEKNISIPTTITVIKTVERKYLKKGEVEISRRENSYGDIVYTRAATDDEVMQKQNSMVSKAMRNGILRLLPGDIQAECRDRILEVRHGAIIKTPEEFAKKVADGFGKIGVKVSALEKYIGHDLTSCSPNELGYLRDIYTEIKEGNTTWSQVIAGDDTDEQVEPEGPKTEEQSAIDILNGVEK